MYFRVGIILGTNVRSGREDSEPVMVMVMIIVKFEHNVRVMISDVR